MSWFGEEICEINVTVKEIYLAVTTSTNTTSATVVTAAVLNPRIAPAPAAGFATPEKKKKQKKTPTTFFCGRNIHLKQPWLTYSVSCNYLTS